MYQGRRLKLKYLVIFALVPAVAVVYLLLKNAVALDPLLRVMNLFGTFLHEGGHSTLTLFSGGNVTELVVRPDGSGYAAISGGNFSLSLPAGYLSVTFITALVFLVNNRSRWGELIPFVLGGLYIYLTARYGAKLAGGVTTLLVGYGYGLFLLFIGAHPRFKIPLINLKVEFSNIVWMAVVNIIALYYGLGGLLSLEYLTRHAAHGNPDDVSVFTDMFYPWAHPTHTAWIWLVASLVVWLIVIFFVVRGFLRKEEA